MLTKKDPYGSIFTWLREPQREGTVISMNECQCPTFRKRVAENTMN
jgi:hypothetical protein